MFKKIAATLIFAIILQAPCHSSQAGYPKPGDSLKISLSGGRENYNYEETGSDNFYYSGRALGRFMDYLSINCSWYYNADDRKRFYSYGFSAEKIYGFFNIYGGNFRLNTGSGLILGKKAYMSPDPFSGRLYSSPEREISLLPGGNPSYSFHGSGAKVLFENDGNSLSITPFYSIRRRFISREDVSCQATSSSMNTILTKISPHGDFSDPVFIEDKGFITTGIMKKTVTFSCFMYQSEIEDEDGHRIRWNMGKVQTESGVGKVRNMGMFLSFKNDSLNLFTEAASTMIFSESQLPGKGIKWGLSYRNKPFRFTISGKNTTKGFYSPYSSGRTGPEEIMEAKSSYRLNRVAETGIRIYTEKDLTPDTYDSDLDRKRVEEIHLRFKPARKSVYTGRYRRLSYSDNGITRQYSLSGTESFLRSFRLKQKFLCQVENSVYSKGIHLGASIILTEKLSIESGYSYIIPGENCSLYWSSMPGDNNRLTGSFYREQTGVFVIKGVFRGKKSNATLRYEKKENRKNNDSLLSFSFSLTV